jgi:hypothetical protein
MGWMNALLALVLVEAASALVVWLELRFAPRLPPASRRRSTWPKRLRRLRWRPLGVPASHPCMVPASCGCRGESQKPADQPAGTRVERAHRSVRKVSLRRGPRPPTQRFVGGSIPPVGTLALGPANPEPEPVEGTGPAA